MMGHESAVLKSITGETMALLGVAAKGSVNGLLFELSVEQRYRNPAATNIEAVYTFPLPSSAVLLDFGVTLGDKQLTGVVVERKKAEAQYEEAIDKGDTAIMLERAGDGLLTVNLGNLMAGEEATIRYRYAQLLRFEHGSVRLTVPTVIAPRYGDPAAGGLQPHQVPVNDLLVEYPFKLSLELRGAIATGTIASPSHQIAIARTDHSVTVTLNQSARLDRDFVLTASGLPSQSVSTVARDGDGYVALASFCADVPKTAEELPLRLKLVVDCSGSMAGDSIEAAKRALHRVLAGLVPADRFSFTRFGSSVVHEIGTLVAADPPAIRKAAERLSRTQADLGGTEMEDALRAVFAVGGEETRGGSGADVMLITDGEIWGADALIAEARGAQQRVFVVGIGSAPAEGVLRRLADATGGACEFVAPGEDAEAAIVRMFARLRAPRVRRSDIAWPQSPKWVTPIPNGLFGGETIHVFAGFDALPVGEVALSLLPAGGGAAMTARTMLPDEVSDLANPIAENTPRPLHSTCARMAAATRIESADPAARLALALQYSLLTDQTNFIVVHARAEGEKARSLPELRTQANMLAAGWGGVGSVAEAKFSMDYPCLAAPEMVLSGVSVLSVRKSRTYEAPDYDDYNDASLSAPKHVPEVSRSTSGPLFPLWELERDLVRGVGFWHRQLPETLDELACLKSSPEILARLRELVALGHDERVVVRAILENVRLWMIDRNASRQLLRALRNLFMAPEEHADVRAAVKAILAQESTHVFA